MKTDTFSALKATTLLSDKRFFLIVLTLSCIISFLVMFIQHGWINDDSVLYFEVARLFSIGEWKQGFKLYSWPFYPALISIVHLTTSLSIQTSAQLLNGVFFGLSTFSFLRLILLAGGNKTTLLCGVFLLFSSAYIVGDILPMLIRDQGFWAMFLTSLAYFIQYYREHKIAHALLWQLFIILALMFRIEAATYLVGLPFILLFDPKLAFNQRIKHFFCANIISIAGFLGIAGALLMTSNLNLHDFGRLQETVTIPTKIITQFVKVFELKADIMGKEVLGSFLDDYGTLSLIMSLISIVITKILSTTGWPVMAIFALNKLRQPGKKNVNLQLDSRRIFNWIIIIALINASIILLSEFILSGRYIIALVLVLLVLAAFQLDNLVGQFSKIGRWQKIIFVIIIASLMLNIITNMLPKRSGYNFEQDAVTYLKQQQVPNNKVFFVSPRSRYYADADYAGRGYAYWDYTQKAILNGEINRYDYLLLNMNNDAQLDEKQRYLNQRLTQYKLEKEFYSHKKKKKIMLYKKLNLAN